MDNNDTLNTTQSDSESTDQGETVTNSTSGHVQTTEHSTVRNTQTEESSAMSTSTSEGKHSGVQLLLFLLHTDTSIFCHSKIDFFSISKKPF